MLAEITTSNALTVGVIIAGALVAFYILNKIVKFILSLALVAVLVAAAVIYCVKAGYISSETAERINPLNDEKVVSSLKEAGTWVGDRAKDVAKKALVEAVNETASDDASAAR